MKKRPKEIFGDNQQPFEKGVFWRLAELEHSFQFYIGSQEEPEREVFFEAAELFADTDAFADEEPKSALDVMNELEVEKQGFDGIIIEKNGNRLIRKRLSKQGVLFVNGTKKNFFSDKSLSTVNFGDFYEEYLVENPKTPPAIGYKKDEHESD